jgi:SAM-dependent methyltransferase
MTDIKQAGETATRFFQDIWKQGDYWALETSPWEQAKYQRQIGLLNGRRFERILEIGCGAGVFTRQLATIGQRVLAIDVAPAAVERAIAGGDAAGRIEYRVANIMQYDPASDGPFDLIVLSETIYYLGWLYSFFDVAWRAAVLFDATADDGVLLMCNTRGGLRSYLHRPWLLKTYQDLLRNIGYVVETEDTFAGEKDDVRLEADITILRKPAGSEPVAT